MYSHNAGSFCALAALLAILPSASIDAQSRTWTTEADFEAGFLHHTRTIGDELRIHLSSRQWILPYIWVACTERNTVVRIATAHSDPMTGRTGVEPGDVLGEYYSAPDGCRFESRATRANSRFETVGVTEGIQAPVDLTFVGMPYSIPV